MSAKYVCCMCMVRQMAVRLDRKGRPMCQCGNCGAIVFTRGLLAVHNLIATMRLLDVAENLHWVRREGFAGAEAPESLLTLLQATPTASASAPTVAAPAAAEYREAV